MIGKVEGEERRRVGGFGGFEDVYAEAGEEG